MLFIVVSIMVRIAVDLAQRTDGGLTRTFSSFSSLSSSVLLMTMMSFSIAVAVVATVLVIVELLLFLRLPHLVPFGGRGGSGHP